MASVFRDKSGMIADFRPVFAVGKQRRRVRIPNDHPSPEQLAQELEQLSRALERFPVRPDDIDRAAALKAITADEADRIRKSLPTAPPPAEITIEAAALAHPSTIREQHANPKDYDRHLRELREFVAITGTVNLRHLSLDVVLKAIEHWQKEGRQPHGIRHRLLWIRRASRLAPGYGLRDTIPAKIKLVFDDNPDRTIDVWGLEELAAAAAVAIRRNQHRELAAVALGGMMGLRSSEIIRAKVGDVEGSLLYVGRIRAKNRASRRVLPIPDVIKEWLAPLLTAEPDSPLIAPWTKKRAKGTHMNGETYAHWMGGFLRVVTGKDYPPKCLRKSFLTWGDLAGIDAHLLEGFLGHKASHVSAVSADSYLRTSAAKLLPAAREIDRIVRVETEKFLQDAQNVEATHFVADS